MFYFCSQRLNFARRKYLGSYLPLDTVLTAPTDMLCGVFLFFVHLTKKKITGDNFTTVMCPNIHYRPTALFGYIYCLTDYFCFCFANQFVAFNFKFVAIFQRVVSGIFVIIFYTSTDKINTLERLKCFSASRLNFVKHGHDCSPFSPNNYVCSKGSFQYFPNVTAFSPLS